jgi:hypothetical protein
MHLDKSHIAVGALQRLAPEMLTAGGSFAAWLPHPGTLSPQSRPVAFRSAQLAAVEQCVQELIRKAGLPDGTKVATGEGGERLWPAGLIGSLTDKGTVVLGVIAREPTVRMVGIDLECTDRSDLSTIAQTVAAEGLPSQSSSIPNRRAAGDSGPLCLGDEMGGEPRQTASWGRHVTDGAAGSARGGVHAAVPGAPWLCSSPMLP